MKYVLVLTLIALLFVATQCQKDTEPQFFLELPPETQTGENTLGFLLNGEVWIPQGAYYSMSGLKMHEVIAWYYPGTFGNKYSIGTGRTVQRHDEILLEHRFDLGIDKNCDSTGVYFLDSVLTGHMSLYDKKKDATYAADRRHLSYIRITKLDTAANIISGTFAGVLYNRENSGDSLIIEQGRFDTRYKE
jgi:hypothetical protein